MRSRGLTGCARELDLRQIEAPTGGSRSSVDVCLYGRTIVLRLRYLICALFALAGVAVVLYWFGLTPLGVLLAIVLLLCPMTLVWLTAYSYRQGWLGVSPPRPTKKKGAV